MANWLLLLPVRNWNKKILILGSTILIFVLSTPAFAHHAKEWLIIESYEVTHKGEVVNITSFDYFDPDTENSADNEWEFTPTFLYGITDHLMLDLHFHLLDVIGVGPFIEAGTVGLQYKLLERGELPIDLGFSMGYEYPTGKSEDVLDGTDLLTFTSIISRKINRWLDITTNLSYEREMHLGDSSEVNWKFGVKGPFIPPIRRRFEGGLEFQGNFDLGADPRVEVVPGVYWHIKGDTVLKAGIGAGLTEEADDVTFRIALVHGFGMAFKNMFNRKERKR